MSLRWGYLLWKHEPTHALEHWTLESRDCYVDTVVIVMEDNFIHWTIRRITGRKKHYFEIKIRKSLNTIPSMRSFRVTNAWFFVSKVKLNHIKTLYLMPLHDLTCKTGKTFSRNAAFHKFHASKLKSCI